MLIERNAETEEGKDTGCDCYRFYHTILSHYSTVCLVGGITRSPSGEQIRQGTSVAHVPTLSVSSCAPSGRRGQGHLVGALAAGH
jgi:hypothetical protein